LGGRKTAGEVKAVKKVSMSNRLSENFNKVKLGDLLYLPAGTMLWTVGANFRTEISKKPSVAIFLTMNDAPFPGEVKVLWNNQEWYTQGSRVFLRL